MGIVCAASALHSVCCICISASALAMTARRNLFWSHAPAGRAQSPKRSCMAGLPGFHQLWGCGGCAPVETAPVLTAQACPISDCAVRACRCPNQQTCRSRARRCPPSTSPQPITSRLPSRCVPALAPPRCPAMSAAPCALGRPTPWSFQLNRDRRGSGALPGWHVVLLAAGVVANSLAATQSCLEQPVALP